MKWNEKSYNQVNLKQHGELPTFGGSIYMSKELINSPNGQCTLAKGRGKGAAFRRLYRTDTEARTTNCDNYLQSLFRVIYSRGHENYRKW